MSVSAKKRLKLIKTMFEESGIDKKVFERIEDKCIAMSHLMFPQSAIIDRMNQEVKSYLNDNERFRFNFVNIAEKYDLDITFLD